MVLKKLLYSVVGCMLFTSCYDEDALTPGDRVLESRFEFPQGSNSWDEEAQDILDEFGKALYTGSVDPDEYLPKLLEKLDDAGVQKVIDEMQRQVDVWKEGR